MSVAAERVVVVSTHLDDAVLSCWSLIDGATNVTVVTVFTGGPEPGFLGEWDSDSGARDSATRMQQRRAEDVAALAIAGCARVHVGLLEVEYGGGVCPPEAMAEHLAAADVVYAPAGIGLRHVNKEHGGVRDAVLALRPDARLYADQPYCGFRPDTQLASDRAREVVALGAQQRERKVRAIRCYAGELPKLERPESFGPFARPDQLEYEVFWSGS
ncbi:MAG: LmbE-like protein [Actinomycetia bacterium]|nr:LmbE-like protein [Actinomycetes bacterium]